LEQAGKGGEIHYYPIPTDKLTKVENIGNTITSLAVPIGSLGTEPEYKYIWLYLESPVATGSSYLLFESGWTCR
jgi:hypothetical protein